MLLVVMFIVLFTALLGVVFRELAGALRVETLHRLEVQRDTGSIVALAQALALLQTGTPPGNPYACSTTPPGCTQSFIVTFSSPDQVNWTVLVSPSPSGGGLPPPMPGCFDPHGFDWAP